MIDEVLAASPSLAVYATAGAIRAMGATVTANTATIVTGGDGWALRYVDATTKLEDVPDFSGDRTFTLAAWVKLQPGYTTRRIMERTNGSTGIIMSASNAGEATVTLSSTAGGYNIALASGRKIDDGAWHLITLTCTTAAWGGLDALLYVDGDETRKGWIHPGLFGRNPNLTMTTPMWLGRSADWSAPLQGDIAIAAMWDSPLSPSTISGLAAAAPTTVTQNIGWGIVLR